jgi:hypothetical protein
VLGLPKPGLKPPAPIGIIPSAFIEFATTQCLGAFSRGRILLTAMWKLRNFRIRHGGLQDTPTALISTESLPSLLGTANVAKWSFRIVIILVGLNKRKSHLS